MFCFTYSFIDDIFNLLADNDLPELRLMLKTGDKRQDPIAIRQEFSGIVSGDLLYIFNEFPEKSRFTVSGEIFIHIGSDDL